MSRVAIRLTLRLHRFELFAFAAATSLLFLAAVAQAAHVNGLRPGPECLAATQVVAAACEQAGRRFYDAQQPLSGLLTSSLVVVTFAIGLFLGVPIVARELERGTVRLAWSLAPSRWRWYLVRLLPILVVVIALTFAAGIAEDRLLGSVFSSGPDLSRSFDGYGMRGGLLASRAIFVFAVAVAVGSIIGRALPALILAGLIAAIGLTGGIEVHQRMLQGEAVAIPMSQDGSVSGSSGDLFIDQKFQLPDGSLVSWNYFPNGDPFDQNGNPRYPMVSIVIPGERYRLVEARESLVLGGGSLGFLLLGGIVVSRRRPG